VSRRRLQAPPCICARLGVLDAPSAGRACQDQVAHHDAAHSCLTSSWRGRIELVIQPTRRGRHASERRAEGPAPTQHQLRGSRRRQVPRGTGVSAQLAGGGPQVREQLRLRSEAVAALDDGAAGKLDRGALPLRLPLAVSEGRSRRAPASSCEAGLGPGRRSLEARIRADTGALRPPGRIGRWVGRAPPQATGQGCAPLVRGSASASVELPGTPYKHARRCCRAAPALAGQASP